MNQLPSYDDPMMPGARRFEVGHTKEEEAEVSCLDSKHDSIVYLEVPRKLVVQ
jgi:hypothetical protein